MRHFRTMTAVALAGALIATGCTTDPYTGQRTISKTALGTVGGLVGGYLAGDVIGGRRDRNAKVIGAGIGALAGAAVGNYMDRQEADLRRQTVGTGVDVIRSGNDLILRMPSAITFPVNSFAIEPQFRATLNEVASTLSKYDQTYVDVLGHTDATGSDALNQRLSVNRAQAVASYLSTRRIASARVGVRGYGESAPIASNDTETGRAANRRVEIKVVPVTQGQGY
ncbi:MAG TPA: OmpA family protein [Sphingomicrobium sp.]|nr:OmpA family protein [Sphingomicrobium sp.]